MAIVLCGDLPGSRTWLPCQKIQALQKIMYITVLVRMGRPIIFMPLWIEARTILKRVMVAQNAMAFRVALAAEQGQRAIMEYQVLMLVRKDQGLMIKNKVWTGN